MAQRQEVLSAYRRILRLAKTWEAMTGVVEDTVSEKQYIISEAKNLFRKNKHVKSADEIKLCIQEAETRIELALHYRIPYPRLVNLPQSILPPKGIKLKKSQKKLLEQAQPIYLKSYTDDKN